MAAARRVLTPPFVIARPYCVYPEHIAFFTCNICRISLLVPCSTLFGVTNMSPNFIVTVYKINHFWASDFIQTRNKPWTNFQIFIISQHQCFKQSVKIQVHENITSYIISTHWGSQGPSGEFKRQSSLKPFFSSHTIPHGGTRPNGKLKLCEYKKKLHLGYRTLKETRPAGPAQGSLHKDTFRWYIVW